jgi:hypothetical protein
LFTKPRRINDYSEKVIFRSSVTNETIVNMHDLDWARYLCESIYCLWFQVLCGVIKSYAKYSGELIKFSRNLLKAIQPKLAPMRETEIIYRRLFEACGSVGQSE